MAILGISGRINSGKDTVGRIIQWHLSSLPKTDVDVQEFLKRLPDLPQSFDSTWQIKKFATKVKQIASLLLGVSIDKFEDREFKNSYLPREYDTLISIPGKRQDGLFGTGEKEIKQMTVREFLQRLGTEAIRNGLHPNTWVNALFADYKEQFYQYKGEQEGFMMLPNWIITDLRFSNEYEAVKKKGGLCIRVERGTQTAYYSDLLSDSSPLEHAKRGEDLHSSETELDSYDFDYVLNNSGSIEDLVEEVRKMLVHFKLLKS